MKKRKLYKIRTQTYEINEEYVFGYEQAKSRVKEIAVAEKNDTFRDASTGVYVNEKYARKLDEMCWMVSTRLVDHYTVYIETIPQTCATCGKEITTETVGAIREETQGIYRVYCKEHV
jgi:trehalose-6-phosphate synthase